MNPRSSRPGATILIVPSLLAIVVACSPDLTSGPGASTPGSAAPGGSTIGSAEPGKPSASLHIDPPPNGEVPSPVGQSDTAWGRIWDRVPAWFPRYPGSSVANDASALPSSARFAVPNGDPRDIAEWLRAALENVQYPTDMSGPLEDGSFTLESVGRGTCRIQTTVTPLGGMTFITVLYGADCTI